MIYKVYIVVYIIMIIALIASCIMTALRIKKLNEATLNVINMSEVVVEQNRILKDVLGLGEREEGDQDA